MTESISFSLHHFKKSKEVCAISMIPLSSIVKIFSSLTVPKSCKLTLFLEKITKNSSPSIFSLSFLIAGSTMIALPISESSISSTFFGLTFASGEKISIVFLITVPINASGTPA